MCPALLIGEHASLNATEWVAKMNASVSCDDGYLLANGQDSVNITCQADGTWSQDISLNPCRSTKSCISSYFILYHKSYPMNCAELLDNCPDAVQEMSLSVVVHLYA